MNIDHEANFVQKALHNFDLFAENYFNYINFETIKAEINDACKTDLGEYNLNIGLKNLKKLYRKYTFLFDNPTILTRDDQIQLMAMYKYLKSHKGTEYGYLKYRKMHYDNEVARFNEMIIQRNTALLAIKDLVFSQIDLQIEYLTHQENTPFQQMKQFVSTEVHKSQKKRWAKERQLCCCGKEYNKANKYAHENTRYHQEFMEGISEKVSYIGEGNNITLKITE